MPIEVDPIDYIKDTQEILSSKVNIFETFPICIKNIINRKMWADVKDKNGDNFKSFESFCKHPLWHGLELEIDELLSYLKKSHEVKALVLGELDEQGEKKAGPGRGNKTNSVTTCLKEEQQPKQSRGTTYLSKRLKRDDPELFSKVVSGELSAHKAAIIAGIKKPMIQVRADDVTEAVKKIINHYGHDDVANAISTCSA